MAFMHRGGTSRTAARIEGTNSPVVEFTPIEGAQGVKGCLANIKERFMEGANSEEAEVVSERLYASSP